MRAPHQSIKKTSKQFLWKSHQTLLLLASEYLCKISTPTLQNEMDGEAILEDDNEKRFIQRAFAGTNFYGFPVGRIVTVIKIKS